MDRLFAGDLLGIRLPASGGYGSPLEREPEWVRWDVLNGERSEVSARNDHGVALHADRTVDEEATARLRERMSGRPAQRSGK